jgi:hypothetical protein
MVSRLGGVFLLLVLVLTTAFGMVYLWLFHPPFSVLEMSLPAALFPNDADYHPMHRARDSLPAIDSGIQTIYWSQLRGLATYNVERLPTLGLATRAYHFYADLSADSFYEHKLPQSPTAHDFIAGCGISEFSGFRCVYTARYREYVATLSVVIDEKMKIEDFEEIVQFIDREFQQRLYGED